MVVVASWLEFLTQARQLYCERPEQTRYSIKYRHADAELLLKVTDDRTCLQWRSGLQSELRYVERISAAFMKLMSSRQPMQLQLTDEMTDDRRIDKKPAAAAPHSQPPGSIKRPH